MLASSAGNKLLEATEISWTEIAKGTVPS
jgi:hypothetical protein